NRAIQPMKGGYTDNYYMQMSQNIRRYKGVRSIPELKGITPITIDGIFSDWDDIEVEYRDTVGDTFHRDYKGYGGLHYANDSGRNDIITCKVAMGEENVSFFVETKEPLTPRTDPNWMLLLIDADQNHDTGWYGYDFLINKKIASDKITTVLKYDSDAPAASWKKIAEISYRAAGSRIELAVPREALDLSGDALSFDFHWCDNPEELKDPISLCTHGDSAPNRRFNYRCIWNK
ncbi:MAG: hypothetical protein KAH38_00615, partial [Candidatus Hydrogenedentes bacterium]|nr:hypothetical protein [Candidatus Hydrogenedentota bacterium]